VPMEIFFRHRSIDMIDVYRFESWQLILGDCSCDIFRHFEIDEMHGLSLVECEDHPESTTPGTQGVYIWGWVNVSPIPGDLPFMFLNRFRMHGDFRDVSAIMHESVHLSLLLHDYDLSLEEEIVTFAEEVTNKIFSTFFI
jgi:hypothetical protein